MNLNTKYGIDAYKRPQWKSNGKSVDLDSIIEIESGSGTFDYLAFPDIGIDSNGKYHGVYRRGSGHNNDNNGFIAYITSSDKGLTWSAPVNIVPYAADRVTNPSITITSTGRIIVFFGWEHDSKRFVYFIYSDDGGNNWSAQIRLTIDYDANQITGPNRAIEINGVLYWAGYATNVVPGGAREGPLYKSIDNGLTWTKITILYPIANSNYEEPSLLKTTDGRMMSLIRSDPDDTTYMIWSPDTIKWSSPLVAYPSIGKNPLATSASGTILTCGRYTTDSRSLWAYSNNGGKTWSYDFLTGVSDLYMYSGVNWDSDINQFVALVSYVPPGADQFNGPTKLVCARFNEI